MRLRIQPTKITCRRSKDPHGDHIRLYYVAATADDDWGTSAISGPTLDRRMYFRVADGDPPVSYDLSKIVPKTGAWESILDYDGGLGKLNFSFLGIHSPVDVPEEEDWVGGGGGGGFGDLNIWELVNGGKKTFSLTKTTYEFADASAKLSEEIAKIGKVKFFKSLGEIAEPILWIGKMIALIEAIVSLFSRPDCRGVAFKTVRDDILEGDIQSNIVKNGGRYSKTFRLDAVEKDGCPSAQYEIEVLFEALDPLTFTSTAPQPRVITRGESFTYSPGRNVCNVDSQSFNSWSLNTAFDYHFRANFLPSMPILWSIGGFEVSNGSLDPKLGPEQVGAPEIELLLDVIRVPYDRVITENVKLRYVARAGTDREFASLTIWTGASPEGVFTPGNFQIAVSARVQTMNAPIFETLVNVAGQEQTGDADYQEYIACQNEYATLVSRFVDYQPFGPDPIGPKGPRMPEIRLRLPEW